MSTSASTTMLDASQQLAHRERERLLTKDLESSREKLWTQSQALLERSRVRTALGDKLGALRDAKGALALFPAKAEYLARASEALLDCGHPEKASKAFDSALAAVEDGDEDIEEDFRESLRRLARRLRPLNYLPSEVLIKIFEFVQSDWERLPSPFQLCHVSRGWRALANSTQSLWRDLRILRIDTKVPTEDSFLSDGPLTSRKLRKPYLFSADDIMPELRCIHPKDRNHTNLILECARKSNNSLTHFDFESLQTDRDPADDVFKVVTKSAATLRSISVAHNAQTHGFAEIALRLALQCPRLVDLELAIGRINAERESKRIEDAVQDLELLPPTLRSLKLDGVDCFSGMSSRASQLLLNRCAKLESLRLLGHWSAPLSEHGVVVVAVCAKTLINLETSAGSHLFAKLAQTGCRTLPELRRFRHVSSEGGRELVLDLSLVSLPKLECLEGPLEIVGKFTPLPAKVVLRIDVANPCKVTKIATWLRDALDGGQLDAVEDLTFELLCLHSDDLKQFGKVVDALTPDTLGKVICPRLSRLAVLVRDELAKGGENNALTIGSAPQRTPLFREEWEGKLDVSRVVRMEALRRRVAQGLPVERTQRQLKECSSAFKRGSRAETAEGATAETTAEVQASRLRSPATSCVALQSITLEGCYIEEAAWNAMRNSTTQCRYDVTPDPDLMIRLPFEGPRKKKAKLGERRVHAW